MERILLVDDNVRMKTIVSEVLTHQGFEILSATNGQEALEVFQANNISVVLLDVELPDIDGIELLNRFVRQKPSVPVVMISGVATIGRAVTATKLGAYDFLEKPLDPQRVFTTIKNAIEKSRVEEEQQILIQVMMDQFGVIGVSDSVRKLYSTASRIARFQTPVLITGENGTGKELLANVIHRLSGRSTMVSVNCAAVPHELIESELFGHRKGSFTGAVTDHTGKFQAANRGTLFLDEIGDMSLDMQAKILRAIETRKVSMVGSAELVPVDVRFVAATNKNLTGEIREGRFREDLFYRLRGVTLHVPPLRERPEDISPLANFFLQRFCIEQNLPPKRFADRALGILQEQQWRGNVRELKYVVENLAIFSDDDTIDHLQVLTLLQTVSQITGSKPQLENRQSLKETTLAYEKALIQQALAESHDNITHAAEKLGIDRATLSKKIKRYGLKP